MTPFSTTFGQQSMKRLIFNPLEFSLFGSCKPSAELRLPDFVSALVVSFPIPPSPLPAIALLKNRGTTLLACFIHEWHAKVGSGSFCLA